MKNTTGTTVPNKNDDNLAYRLASVKRAQSLEIRGRISGMTGLTVEAQGFVAPVGAKCLIMTRQGDGIPAEVIGFRGGTSIIMPLAEMVGITRGDSVVCLSPQAAVPIGDQLLGRVVDGHGRAIDDLGQLLCQTTRPIVTGRLGALDRVRIDQPVGTGIVCVDTMMTCGAGQRLGIFSGPGVGKSVLLGMIARNTAADVCVIGLVGERGREVREFIDKDLGPEGLARSVVVVSTSDEPAPLRVQAGFVAASIAEYFRDRGKNVLLLVDSVTRIAMAQRQIGLALGEPPATKGYTPSVFGLLPKLIERCGKTEKGSITGFYTVLVEGDDLAEPISDAMRGLLDGHIWLSRSLANRGHYPAIDMLESISRVMVDVVDKEHLVAARKITRLISIYRDIEDLVNIGAYATGTNSQYDLAIRANEPINDFMRQEISERFTFEQSVARLKKLADSLNETDEPIGAVNQNQAKAGRKKPQERQISSERMMVGV